MTWQKPELSLSCVERKKVRITISNLSLMGIGQTWRFGERIVATLDIFEDPSA